MHEIITNNLDLWCSALLAKSSAGRGSNGKQEAYGVKKLRGLILELAVRGKLVRQDPNDESAEKLAQRIKSMKLQLIKAGKIGKSPDATPIAASDQPYELPTTWAWVPLGNVTSIRTGKLDANASSANGQYPFFTCARDPLRIDRYAYEGECVLLAGNGNFDVNYYDGKFEAYQRTYIIEGIDRDMISGSYLYRFVQHYAERLREMSIGGVISYIKIGFLTDAPFPLPPLAEQQRIVAKVDELMAVCDQLEQHQTHSIEAHQTLVETLLGTLTRVASQQELSEAWNRIANYFDTLLTTDHSIDQLKQTILQLAVRGKLVPQDPKDEPASVLLRRITEEKERLIKEGRLKREKPLPPLTDDEMLFPLPSGWSWTKFGVLAEFINGDRSKNYPNRSEYVDDGVAWINTGHIEPHGRLTTQDMNFISREKFDSLNSGKIQKGDLVYCLRGATFGKTAFVEPYQEGAIASSLMIIRPFITELNKYIFHYLLSPFGKKQLLRFDNGSAQPNLSAGNVMLYACPLPPLAEQHRIVAKVDELMALCDALRARLADAQTTQIHLSDAIVEQAVT